MRLQATWTQLVVLVVNAISHCDLLTSSQRHCKRMLFSRYKVLLYMLMYNIGMYVSIVSMLIFGN